MAVIERWWLVLTEHGTAASTRSSLGSAENYIADMGGNGYGYTVVEVVPAGQFRGAVEEAARLRDVLRAVLIEPDPIKRNQLAAPMLTNAGGQ